MEDIKPTYLDDVEEARNRPDKSVLAIRTMCPEKLLVADVAFPEQVKHLWLDLSLDEGDYYDIGKYLYQKDCECPYMDSCNFCSWEKKYTNTLCKDLVNFNQLETLTVTDLNLSSDLWTQFAQNSQCLREIVFTSGNSAAEPYDCFCFDGEFDDSCDHKEKGLEAVLKIPTLKKALFLRLGLPFFPKGPSAIDNLELYVEPYHFDWRGKPPKYDYTNFSSHTNLKSLDISQGRDAPLPLYSLQLEKLLNLKNLVFHGYFDDKKDIDSLKDIINLPKIKDLTIILYKEKSDQVNIGVTYKEGKWTIEEKEKVIITDSKEEILRLIETFELTLVD